MLTVTIVAWVTIKDKEKQDQLNDCGTCLIADLTKYKTQPQMMRLRGGMMGMPNNDAPGNYSVYGTPRQDNVNINRIDRLPIHDSIPQPFFIQTYYKQFVQGLGDKTQDGFTMLAVEDGTHQGGHQWVINNNALPPVPAAAAGGPQPGVIYQVVLTDAQWKASRLRDARLLAIVLLHIDKETPLHAELSAYGTNGYRACIRWKQACHVATSPELNAKLESMWSTMSIESLNLSINNKTISTWAMIVLKFATYFDTPKDIPAIKVTFLRGLTSHMLPLKNVEQDNPNPRHIFPAIYANLLIWRTLKLELLTLTQVIVTSCHWPTAGCRRGLRWCVTAIHKQKSGNLLTCHWTRLSKIYKWDLLVSML